MINQKANLVDAVEISYEKDIVLNATTRLFIAQGENPFTVELSKCSEWVGELLCLKSQSYAPVKFIPNVDDTIEGLDSIELLPNESLILSSAGNFSVIVGRS